LAGLPQLAGERSGIGVAGSVFEAAWRTWRRGLVFTPHQPQLKGESE